VLGVSVAAVGLDGAVAMVRAALAEGRSLRILVANANKAWQAKRDAALREALAGADLVVPEWALTWAAARLGREAIPYVRGIELMGRLLDAAEAGGWSVFFLGARPEVVERLAARMLQQRPTLRLAGYQHGFLDAASAERLEAELVRTAPDLLFVAMGSPRQEYWIQQLPRDSGPRVVMGVGGSFDVFAGIKRDAPRWAQGNGLEWLYRLMQDPRNLWRRYLVTNSWLIAAVLRERLRGRQDGGDERRS
jgi:N-acetylglucosaminyldiphosphoundecaprenol N-acetyl-beta-D-mannosaminyltransferase